MPRKSKKEESENPNSDNILLSPEEEAEILREAVLPHLYELLQKELEVAFSDGPQASVVRGRLIERLIGKTGERATQQASTKLVVNFLQVSKDKLPDPVQVVEGEFTPQSQPELPDPNNFGYDQAEI